MHKPKDSQAKVNTVIDDIWPQKFSGKLSQVH